MKNIHVLPTDKPSRLYSLNIYSGLRFSKTEISKRDTHTPKNIYITSNEEIKEGDWFITDGLLWKANRNIHLINSNKDKKIILTTDQDLIKDGVQAIDDEFLEYYVSVPFGEIKEVEVDDLREISNEFIELDTMPYKIIIPNEEPKQETLEPLEVPMPIENKGVSNWNKSNTTPEFDGEYLCYISCKEECGNIHRYYKVVINTFNTWLINENERVALWKELEENPFNH